jgi:hypothetical protein
MSASTKAFTFLLGACLLVVLGWTVWHPVRRSGASEQVLAKSVGFRIDLNADDAATLELLPRVGPSIAHNIIKARQGGAVFRGPDDLEAVTFIGPSLIKRVGPWVVYDESPR